MKDSRIQRLESFIGDTLAEAVKFPLYFRIAVKLVDAGFTEADFEKGDFPTIPGGLLSDVRIAVRDIERKQVPKISAKSGQRLIDLARQL
jgi:hypothetical protein